MSAGRSGPGAPPAGPVARRDPPSPVRAPQELDPPRRAAAERRTRSSTDLDALLADTQRERDEYLDLAKRTKADFENFRKRMAAEVQAAGARGKAEVLREVVPVLDDLERALAGRRAGPGGGLRRRAGPRRAARLPQPARRA